TPNQFAFRNSEASTTVWARKDSPRIEKTVKTNMRVPIGTCRSLRFTKQNVGVPVCFGFDGTDARDLRALGRGPVRCATCACAQEEHMGVLIRNMSPKGSFAPSAATGGLGL